MVDAATTEPRLVSTITETTKVIAGTLGYLDQDDDMGKLALIETAVRMAVREAHAVGQGEWIESHIPVPQEKLPCRVEVYLKPLDPDEEPFVFIWPLYISTGGLPSDCTHYRYLPAPPITKTMETIV